MKQASLLRFALDAIPGKVCVWIFLMMLSWGNCLAKEPAKTSVADLRYGAALFHYYQQDYLAALSELRVADVRGGIQGHGNNPELIDAGISLAFGMQQRAEKIYVDLLASNQYPEPVRNAAWFYLGKLHYARADWAAATQSFAQISNTFSPELNPELHALQINLQIKKNNYGDITAKNVKQQNLGSWSAYALYNLGAAHARANNREAAKDFFNELKNHPIDHDKKRTEYFVLLDKAYTASGYSLLQEKKYAEAREEFSKVRLAGYESNQALLGYGWAAMAQGKYLDAITPWQLLHKRSLVNPSAQEALLALPFAYEKLNAKADALREYEYAQELFAREIALVRTMRKSLTHEEILFLGSKSKTETYVEAADQSPLKAQLISDGENWLKISDTSIVKTRSMYLQEMFTRNEFQVQILEVRDLLKLQALLQSWQPKLSAYKELLLQKQQLRQSKVSPAQQTSVSQELELREQRDRLSERLTQIKTDEDYIALADADTRAAYTSVQRSQRTLVQLSAAGQDVADYKHRLDLINGLVLWKAAEQFPAALADNEMNISVINSTLSKIALSNKNIAAVSATGSDLVPVLTGLMAKQELLQQQLRQLDTAIAVRTRQLHLQLDKQLASHEKRLQRYQAQTHLAVARLYDSAMGERPQ